MKIEIRAEDNQKYAQIAFLVDREDFKNDIVDIRQRLWGGPLKTGPNYSDYHDWYDELEKEIFALRKLASTPNVEIKLKERYDFISKVKELLVSYGLPSTYFHAVGSTLASGFIDERDWRNHFVHTLGRHNEFFKSKLDITLENEPILELRVTPLMLKKDFENLFDEFKRKLHKKYEKSNYKITKYGKRVCTTIRRDRELYWLYIKEEKRGRGIYDRVVDKYEEIHIPEPDEYPDFTTYEKAILEK